VDAKGLESSSQKRFSPSARFLRGFQWVSTILNPVWMLEQSQVSAVRRATVSGAALSASINAMPAKAFGEAQALAGPTGPQVRNTFCALVLPFTHERLLRHFVSADRRYVRSSG
jgi:hypothetical protein